MEVAVYQCAMVAHIMANGHSAHAHVVVGIDIVTENKLLAQQEQL